MAVSERTAVRRREAFLACLLTEPTVTAAAAKAGVPERTAYRMLEEPDFRARYRQARRDALARATGRLQQTAGEAVETLREVMGSGDTPAPARVSAARAVLEGAFRASELEDLGERLELLEARLQSAEEGFPP